MKGLIKKDLYIARSSLKILLAVFIIFLIMGIAEGSNLFFFPAMMSMSIMLSTFSYDERSKTCAYIASMPKGRQNYIKAKYFSTIIVIIITTIITCILELSIDMIQNKLEIASVMISCLLCIAIVSSIIALIYPTIFKFGIEKSRIGIFIAIFALAGIFAVAADFLPKSFLSNIENILGHFWLIICPIAALILLIISYDVSKKIFFNKEF